MSIKGGKREGAGRKKGAPNKTTQAKRAEIAASGITPLDFMLKIMREPIPAEADISQRLAIEARQLDAAKSAAPYCHAKLSAVEVTGKDGKDLMPQQIDDTELARRICFVLAAADKKAKEKANG